MSLQSGNEASDSYYVNLFANEFSPNTTDDAAERSRRPYLAKTGRNVAWNAEKALNAVREGKYITRFPSKSEGGKAPGKVSSSKVRDNVLSQRWNYLPSVPRSLYSVQNLTNAFRGQGNEGIDDFLRAFASRFVSVPDFVSIGGHSPFLATNPDGSIEVGFMDGERRITVAEAAARQIASDMRAVDVGGLGSNYDAFVSDPSPAEIHLVGNDSPFPNAAESQAFWNVLVNLAGSPFISYLINTGVAGGTSNVGNLYKIWLASYILRVYGYNRLNVDLPEKRKQYEVERSLVSVEKKALSTNYTTYQWVFLSKNINTAVAIMEHSGAILPHRNLLPIMMERRAFVDLVAKAIEKYQVFDASGNVTSVKPVSPGDRRINISSFPQKSNIEDNKYKVYEKLEGRLITLRSYTFDYQRPGTTDVVRLTIPQGLLVVGPPKVSTAGGGEHIVGGRRAIEAALIGLGVFVDLDKAEADSNSYTQVLANIAKGKSGRGAAAKASREIDINDPFSNQTTRRRGGKAASTTTTDQGFTGFQLADR